MSKRIVSYLSIFLICICSACSTSTGLNQAVVIKVGNRSITGEEITKIVNLISLENGIPVSVVWSSMNSIVNKIVDDSLILEYGKDRGIELDEIELERTIQDISQDYPEEGFKEILLARCIDYDEWKQRLHERLLIQKIVKERTQSIGPISYDAIRLFYEQRGEEFSHPPRVKFFHAIASTRNDAEALLARLKGGEDMEKMMEQQGPGYAVQVYRDMIWHTKDMLPTALSGAAFSLPVGQISPVIETPYGFHVIKVVQRELAGRKDLLEVMGAIEEALLSNERERHYARWIEELRQHYPVTVNYTLLDKIRTMNEDQ